MPIREIIPGYGGFHVDATLEVYDELDALLLDHLLDHLQLLAMLASVRAVPDDNIAARLAAHPRYRPFLHPHSPAAFAALLRLLHDETRLLLTLFTAVASGRNGRKENLYRSFRPLIPYIGPPPRDPPAA